MIVVYENACKQAVENEEITKEQAAKVRNYYKGQQKSRKKKEKTKEKHNIIISIPRFSVRHGAIYVVQARKQP